MIDFRLLANLRALGADVDRLAEIPEELADYIAKLTPEDLERIREDEEELRRLGLLEERERASDVQPSTISASGIAKPPPRTLEERARELGTVYAFNSGVFRGDVEVSKEFCDTMLSLALIFNDCRDLLLWMHQSVVDSPPLPVKRNRATGENGGITIHLSRLLAALVHELGEIIRTRSRIFNDPYFQEHLFGKLPPRNVEMWQRVKSLATGKRLDKPMDDLLKLLRDKATYHYDGEELGKAYERRFPIGSAERAKQPLVSLGDSVYARRFYFADAVAQDLIEAGTKDFARKMSEALRDLSATLALLVEVFIKERSGLEPFVEDS